MAVNLKTGRIGMRSNGLKPEFPRHYTWTPQPDELKEASEYMAKVQEALGTKDNVSDTLGLLILIAQRRPGEISRLAVQVLQPVPEKAEVVEEAEAELVAVAGAEAEGKAFTKRGR